MVPSKTGFQEHWIFFQEEGPAKVFLVASDLPQQPMLFKTGSQEYDFDKLELLQVIRWDPWKNSFPSAHRLAERNSWLGLSCMQRYGVASRFSRWSRLGFWPELCSYLTSYFGYSDIEKVNKIIFGCAAMTCENNLIWGALLHFEITINVKEKDW